MPLSYLIPSLQRVNAPSGSSKSMPHPMHAILEPLLLTALSVNEKYRSELALILSNGGGAGEMEEAMMWYAVEHEKPLDDVGGNSPQKHGREGDEGPWTNATWRGQYMERMEGREYVLDLAPSFSIALSWMQSSDSNLALPLQILTSWSSATTN